MNRLTEAWFTFKELKSDDIGVKLAKMFTRTLPALNLTRKQVSGRSGRLRMSDGSFDDVTVKVEFDVPSGDNLHQIDAWLTGSGRLRLSDDPDLYYDAVIETAPQRSNISPRFSGQRYTVTFVCAPFKRLWAPGANTVVTARNTILVNPGTAPALPRIKITGSGDFDVSIGLQNVAFRGVSGGGIIVDSELGDALTFDGAALANECIEGSELFEIQPGTNNVDWALGASDESGGTTSGSVTRIEIEPRWRWI